LRPLLSPFVKRDWIFVLITTGTKKSPKTNIAAMAAAKRSAKMGKNNMAPNTIDAIFTGVDIVLLGSN